MVKFIFHFFLFGLPLMFSGQYFPLLSAFLWILLADFVMIRSMELMEHKELIERQLEEKDRGFLEVPPGALL